jgi:hypothetical protein
MQNVNVCSVVIYHFLGAGNSDQVCTGSFTRALCLIPSLLCVEQHVQVLVAIRPCKMMVGKMVGMGCVVQQNVLLQTSPSDTLVCCWVTASEHSSRDLHVLYVIHIHMRSVQNKPNCAEQTSETIMSAGGLRPSPFGRYCSNSAGIC